MVGLLCVLVFFESNFVCKKQKGEEFFTPMREDLGKSCVLHFSVSAYKARNLPVTLLCELKLTPWKDRYSNLGDSFGFQPQR